MLKVPHPFLLLPLSFFTLTSRAILVINARSGIFSGKQEKNPYKASVSRVRGLNVPKAKEAAKLLRDTLMTVFSTLHKSSTKDNLVPGIMVTTLAQSTASDSGKSLL